MLLCIRKKRYQLLETSNQSCPLSSRSHSELLLPTAFLLFFPFPDYSAVMWWQENLNPHRNSQGPSEVKTSTHKLIQAKHIGNRKTKWKSRWDNATENQRLPFQSTGQLRRGVCSVPSSLNISYSHLNPVPTPVTDGRLLSLVLTFMSPLLSW